METQVRRTEVGDELETPLLGTACLPGAQERCKPVDELVEHLLCQFEEFGEILI